jgi:hypothetical protein
MMGENMNATLLVPKRCNKNKATRMTSETHTTLAARRQLIYQSQHEYSRANTK